HRRPDQFLHPCPRRVGHHARRARAFDHRDRTGDRGRMDRLHRTRSCGRRAMKRSTLFGAAALAALLAACGSEPAPPEYGPNPTIPDREVTLLPSMEVAEPAEWGD